MNLAVLIPKLINFRSLGCVEITVNESFRDSFIFKVVSLYNSEAPAGVITSCAEMTVMVIVSTDAVNFLSAAENIIVYSGVIVLKAGCYA